MSFQRLNAKFARRAALPLLALLMAQGCGEGAPAGSEAETEGKILGGTRVPQGVWNEVSGHSCTGVLIAPRWVLTAAHCGKGNDLVQLAHRTENHAVVSEHLYPNWENTLDLALLELEEPSSIPPALIAHGCGSDYIENGAPIAIVGYGSTVSYPTPQQRFNSNLREGRITITDDTCADRNEGCHVPGGEFQAGTSTVDTCPGDSGGPAYVLTDIGPLVAGITARVASNDPDLDQSCGVVPGIYTRPDAAIDWIERTIGQALPEPECDGSPPPPPPGGGDQCSRVPEEYIGVNDGCDCPSNGNQNCDPDCAEHGNAGGESCGCEYCY